MLNASPEDDETLLETPLADSKHSRDFETSLAAREWRREQKEDYCATLSRRLENQALGGFMARGRRLPPSMERLWLGELRRAHARHHK
jgi:hypothetical protein